METYNFQVISVDDIEQENGKMKTIQDVYALLKDIADNHKDADHFPPSTPVVDYFKILDILNRHMADAPTAQACSEREYETLERERKALDNQVDKLQKRIDEIEEKPQEKFEKQSNISEKKMSELYHEIHELTREIGRLEKSHDTLNLDYQKLKNRLESKEDIIDELRSLLRRYEEVNLPDESDAGFSLTEEEISDITDVEPEKNEFRKVFDNIGFYCKCGWSGDDAKFNPDITGSYQCPECAGPVYTKIKFKHETGEKFEWGGKVWEYCRIGDPYPHDWIAIDKENGNVKAVIKPGSLKDKYHNCWIVKPANSLLSVAEAR